MIDKLFKYYLEHQEELVKEYDGKYLIITNEGVVGAYDTLNEGYEFALQTYGKGNFMLQLCSEGGGEGLLSKVFYFKSRVLMEPVAFTFRNSRLTAELMTPCGVGAAQLSSEPFSVTGFVQYNALWDTGATASVVGEVESIDYDSVLDAKYGESGTIKREVFEMRACCNFVSQALR